MEYGKIVEGRFLQRPNRFIAQVWADGAEQTAHVKNTGRCRELLLPGVTVYLEYAPSPTRKTAYSLVAVQKGDRLINMDSQAPNKVLEEALRKGLRLPGMDSAAILVRREYTFGESRLDFLVEHSGGRMLVEVKGVTLEEGGRVFFPDAPTERGIKHIRELQHAVGEDTRCAVVFVVQMENVSAMRPNDKTHAAFGDALREASKAGVQVCAYTCKVTPKTLVLDEEIEVIL